MLKVKCYSGYKVNERPVAFSLHNRQYLVKEVVDRWYGEGSVYFKVEADDDNIYLLKYDEGQDHWDLVFYQNPKKLESVSHVCEGFNFMRQMGKTNPKRTTPLN